MKNRLLVQTNDPAGNQILVYDRAEDGSLHLDQIVDTGGIGGRNEGAEVDPLASQDSLVYDPQHCLLFAVNAGSDTVSVLGMHDYQVTLNQVLPSGGTFPFSLAVHDELLYVVNAHGVGTISGYRIADGTLPDRGLHPLPGTRSRHRTRAVHGHPGPDRFHPR